MSKSDRPVKPPPSPIQNRGYQPDETFGYRPRPQGGHQPTTSQGAPTKPPSNPPNQGTSGKK